MEICSTLNAAKSISQPAACAHPPLMPPRAPGEDVGHYGGSYKVTYDLHRKYGDMRLLDTPICGALLHDQHISLCCVQFQAGWSASAGCSRERRLGGSASFVSITSHSPWVLYCAMAGMSEGAGAPHLEVSHALDIAACQASTLGAMHAAKGYHACQSLQPWADQRSTGVCKRLHMLIPATAPKPSGPVQGQ